MQKTYEWLAFAVVVILVYAFVIRPAQKDTSLQDCLHSAEFTPLSSGTDVYMKNRDQCARLYGS